MILFMETETIFYIVGGFFAVLTILYFTWDYLLLFTKGIKLLMLICLVIMFFFLGVVLRGRDI